MYFLIIKVHITAITVFVNDIVLFTNNLKSLKYVKDKIFSQFPMKDLGPIRKCFGFNIVRESREKNHSI